jgi:predicted transposase YbfD/YdcC
MWVDKIIRLENGTITHDDLGCQKSQGLAKTLSTSTILLLVGSPLMMTHLLHHDEW